LKPANILIAFDGSLKIADFGMATTWPVARGIDGEGDRTYLAPEAFQGRFDKPNDVYQVGLIMFEIAGNVDLPENGPSWQRLRNGDFREVPSLTWSSESSLNRDAHGEPIDDSQDAHGPTEEMNLFDSEEDPLKDITIPAVPQSIGGLVTPPDFMVNEFHSSSIHQMTLWMMNQDPDQRPTIEQVYSCYGCQWVAGRARAGATVYEGVWGPADNVLDHDFPMADMMDTS
jgi:mitosis inhibitor protein kinase SWE1